MKENITVKAPARVCFFGDHQDYLGLPVIAATIDRYIYMDAQPMAEKKLVIELLDFSQTLEIHLNEDLKHLKPRDYFRSALRVLRKEGVHLNQGYHIQIWGDIPIQSGLSSSSAIVVAWIRLILKIAKPEAIYSDKKIAELSYATEVLEFNEPGGIMDHYTIALGGLLYIDTATKTYKKLQSPWDRLIVVDSGLEKKTIDVLSHIKTHALEALKIVQHKHPSFDLFHATAADLNRTIELLPPELRPIWSAAIHNHLITQKGLTELQKPTADISQLHRLIEAHQNILQNDLKNTPDAMVEMMQVAQSNGGRGIKIVGSGGGGCFIVFTNQTSALDLVDALKTHGVKEAFITQITLVADV